MSDVNADERRDRGVSMTPLKDFDANAAALFLLFLVLHSPDPSPETRRRVKQLCSGAVPILQSRRMDSLYYLAADPDAPAQTAYDFIWDIQRRHARTVLKSLSEAHVDVHVFKGVELLERYFHARALSLISDLDILVPPADIAKTKEALRNLGYDQSDFDSRRGVMLRRTDAEISQYEENSNEVFMFSKIVDLPAALPETISDIVSNFPNPVFHVDGKHLLILSVDVHHTLSRNLDMADVYSRSVPSIHGIGKTLSPSDHFWFTALKYYLEVGVHGEGKNLRTLAYLCAMLRSGVSWPVVIEQVKKLRSETALYYVTTFLAKLHGTEIPSILNHADPRDHSRVRDWGWQMPKLFGFMDRLPPEFEASIAEFRNILR